MNWFERSWNSKWNYPRRFLEWEKKRTEAFWEEFYEPLIEEELDICLALDGGRFRLHKLVDNIEWEEKDGL